MANSTAINTLLELATKACEMAAIELGKSIQFAEETDKKLNLLVQYREDYECRFQAEQAKGLSIAGYRNFQVFLDKLEQAITGQQQVVIESKQRVEERKRAWQAAEQKKMSYDTLADRRRKESLRKEAKRDQKQTDEFVTRQAHQKQQPQ